MAYNVEFTNNGKVTIIGDKNPALIVDPNWSIASTWGSGNWGTSVYRGSRPAKYVSDYGLTGFTINPNVHKIHFTGDTVTEFFGDGGPFLMYVTGAPTPGVPEFYGVGANGQLINGVPIQFKRLVPTNFIRRSSDRYAIRIWDEEGRLTFDSGYDYFSNKNNFNLKLGDIVRIEPGDVVIPFAAYNYTRVPNSNGVGGKFWKAGLERVNANNFRVTIFGVQKRTFDARLDDYFEVAANQFNPYPGPNATLLQLFVI